MLRGVDHIVIAVPELDAAAKAYRALGFTVVPGGRHPVGTHNALIAFEDGSYIELIAFYDPNPRHKWWEPLRRGGGLVDFCMQTDALMADTRALRAAGVAIDDPSPLSRKRPDGYQLRWVLSIPREPHRGVAPFLIEDETPRRERVPRRTRHANGATGIGTITIALADPGQAGAWFARALGARAAVARRADVGGTGVRLTFGPHTLDYQAPEGGRGPLAPWLAARGPSPYGATLRRRARARGPLDRRLTEGARLDWD
jgi:catechol 2,3-dioxygenase-like lactoylglutathione lyase family enzyme